MATPKKLPSGKWRVQVFSHSEKGKRKYVSFTAPTKAEANRLAAEFQSNKEHEDMPQNITIGEAVDKFISSRSNVISPSTLVGYNQIKKAYFDSISNIRLGAFTALDLQNFVNSVSEGRSPKTVRNIYSLLYSSIKLCSNRKFSVTLPESEEVERHIPTDADVNALIENANRNLKLAIVLGSQGLRRGEIASLKYGDILRDFNAIHIHSDMVISEEGWVYKNTPKKKSSNRKLILPKEVINLLGDGDDDEYIVKMVPDSITKRFIDLRDSLGLLCRFHDLRHYAASILHSIGVPDAYIMERGGWSNDKVLKSIYRNSLSDKSDHFTSIANDYFEKNVMPKNSTSSEMQHEMQHDKNEIQ